MKIEVLKLVGQNCITLDDGKKVYDRIHSELLAGRAVELDFAGVAVFASPFFNAAVGQLLKDNSPQKLNQLLRVVNLTSDGTAVLRRVIENAKQYFSDPKIRKATDEVISEQSKDK